MGIEKGRGELWKDGARFLQHRLRDRFRFAVDRHLRHSSRVSEGYLSLTTQRWLHRFRDFRRESLPSSSTFYRKTVSEDIDAEEDSVLNRALQAVAVPVIGNICHVFMHGLNRVQIYGAEKLHHALLSRPKNKPLITVSNHVASVDDPFVIASLLPPSVMLDAQTLRWTMCATDRCFSNPVTSAFFKSVKVLPLSRGEGIYQKGMDVAISKLNHGGWVHIFPEGSRSRDGGKTIGSAKRGIGRMVLDADNSPMVVPFVHTGMEEVMPIGAKFPRVGKTVTILIGDPIEFSDLRNMEETQYVSRGKLYDAVSARIGDRLKKLKTRVDRLATEQSLQSHNYPSGCSDRAARILQQVDWESLGMESYVGTDCESLRQRQSLLAEEKLEDNSAYHYFNYGGGMVSRIRGYMDPTELMGFAARGLFTSSMKGNMKNVQGDGPFKAWNAFWEQMHHSHGFPSNLILA